MYMCIMGLQWKIHLGGSISVTVVDRNPAAVSNIKKNCALNSVTAATKPSSCHGERNEDEVEEVRMTTRDESRHPVETSIERRKEVDGENFVRTEVLCGASDRDADTKSNINGDLNDSLRSSQKEKSGLATDAVPTAAAKKLEIICGDANLVMRQRYFDFIHLDPYGCATPFLDSAFSNISSGGVLSITSTDTAALYGQCPQVTRRHYGGQVAKCEYLKELSARLVVAAAVRAAARCNKGVEVLACVAVEHFVLVILRVRRGAGQADRSVGQVKHVLHCQMCKVRCFVDNSLTVPSSLYPLLPCSCHQNSPGKTAVLLGPVWSGGIYDPEFVGAMKTAGTALYRKGSHVHLLQTLYSEAVCSSLPSHTDATSAPRTEGAKSNEETATEGCDVAERPLAAHTAQEDVGGARSVESDEEDLQPKPKRRKEGWEEDCAGQPAFFFSMPLHSVKDTDCPKISHLISCLQEKGFRASRTHFDPQGVRTDAGLAEFQAILRKSSTPTQK
ncbi:TRMT1-like protein isoform X2 [Diadema setosum]|uniref:TRMT1-like protein isoform X2 n=1 Tax=Diadema setosum TaxID=31175 RepID=UPI003B3A0272